MTLVDAEQIVEPRSEDDGQPPWHRSPSEPASEPSAKPPRTLPRSRDHRRCHFEKADGLRCAKRCIRGGFYCHSHATDFTHEQAKLALLSMVEPAFEVLFKAMGTTCEYVHAGDLVYCKVHGLDCPKWADRIKAAQIVVDRSGFGPSATLKIGEANGQNEFVNLDRHQLVAELESLTVMARQKLIESAIDAEVLPNRASEQNPTP